MSEALLQIIVEEIKDIKARMVTKDDSKNFATKDDLKNFATKDDIKEIRADMKKYATKDDVKVLYDKIDQLDYQMNQNVISLLKIIDKKLSENAQEQQIHIDKNQDTVEALEKRTFALEVEQARIKRHLSLV